MVDIPEVGVIERQQVFECLRGFANIPAESRLLIEFDVAISVPVSRYRREMARFMLVKRVWQRTVGRFGFTTTRQKYSGFLFDDCMIQHFVKATEVNKYFSIRKEKVKNISQSSTPFLDYNFEVFNLADIRNL